MDKKQEYFDSHADDWERELTAEDLERLDHIIDRIDISSGIRVCDLGCGPGVLFNMLRHKVGEQGYIAGVDFSPRAVQKARQNFPFHNIGVVEADAERIPFSESTFDLVIAFAVFAHFPHKDQALEEGFRILKPEGRYVIVHLYGSHALAEEHHRMGPPIDKDELPDESELTGLFKRGRFERFELTDTNNLYMAVGYKNK
jgi:ubiquinone/menaquinone biosynthesis C-methylase UbiE